MSRNQFLVCALFVCALSSAACYNSTAAPAPQAHTRVLFVGNSLTYYNDLPRTVAAIAASAGDTMDVAMAAEPNLALIDHLNGGSNAVQLLRGGKWDYVVLQQGPTTTPIGRDSLVIWTKLFDPHIRAAGAKPALFMVWPLDARWDRMSLVMGSYQSAALSVQGVFIPAGTAWTLAHQADASLALYGADNFHPAATGTYLAALTIYERLSGRDARTLPLQAFANGKPLLLPEPAIRLLQEAAHAAITTSSSF